MNFIQKIKDKVNKESTYSKDKSDVHGEVFTPESLIKEMCKALPKDGWYDSTKTYLDPCAGKGNFPVIIIEKLMFTLQKEFPIKIERYKHIIEKQLYMCEYQRESAQFIYDLLSGNGKYKVNLYVGDSLKLPEDFFDLSYEERKIKYPENTI